MWKPVGLIRMPSLFTKDAQESQYAELALDLEKFAMLQADLSSSQPTGGYFSSPTFRQKCLWLSMYFFFNLALTLHNKYMMSSFSYPYLLTSIHAACGSIGTLTLYINGYYKPTRLDLRQCAALLVFSWLYSINIAVSNVSLNLVTVPVHQVVRALSPLIVVVLSRMVLKKRFSTAVYQSLGVITLGVAIATYGDYQITRYGLLLTLLGTFLAAIKTLTTTSFLKNAHGVSLSPLDLLFYISPLACLYMIIAGWQLGELDGFLATVRVSSTLTNNILYLQLFMNGVIAFGLNVVSFNANKKTGAVAISVAANVKQVLSVLLAVVIFNLTITPFNGAGILLTLIGGSWYAYVEFKAKKSTPGFTSPLPSPRLENSKFEA